MIPLPLAIHVASSILPGMKGWAKVHVGNAEPTPEAPLGKTSACSLMKAKTSGSVRALAVCCVIYLILCLARGIALAQVVASLENPAGGVVSGIGQIDGWAFSTDASDPVATVTFSIDGVEAGTVPCCSERLDVATAYPENEQAAGSGFSTKINWGILTEGRHTVSIQVTTKNGEVMRSTDRDIVVAKLADLEFIPGVDMSEATTRMDNDEVVIDGVRVDGKNAEIRLKWDTTLQAFTISSIKNRAYLSDGERLALVQLPAGIRTNEQLPLVILLHGYTMNGKLQDQYFRLSDIVDARRFVLMLPNGTPEDSANEYRFWNAIPGGCCNFYGSAVDDVAYLESLIAFAKEAYNVDAGRVYLVGYSNGAFMAHTLACERPADIAAIVSVAGTTYEREISCAADTPVSVLHIHGDADTTVRFGGGSFGFSTYPGAFETVSRWATIAECDLTASKPGAALDLVATIEGAETAVTVFADGCIEAATFALWRMRGATHSPTLNARFPSLVIDWLFLHNQNM